MSLAPGTRLGPYELLAALGAGGMGEVYRARDPRLGRDVAIKVLPRTLAEDAERARRFEVEARAIAKLNHPNLLQVYDVGTDGQPYLVTELLEGETLRDALAGGALPVRRAIEIATAIAHGLAAAHEQHIVHRDLKPENVFVTRDGRVKILDFGLAKLTRPDGDGTSHTSAPTMAVDTAAGLVLGTVGYMAPEQVRGQAADERSDLFAFGSILYEMVSGSRAFKGDSAADTMSAILREDPPDLTALDRDIPPVLERIVRHCLEKSPSRRFRSAHDLAFQLEAISSLSTSGVVAASVSATTRGPMRFLRQTYDRGMVLNARFTPDGRAVIYSAAWDGGAARLYMRPADSPDSIALPLPGADVLSVARTGELAIQLDPQLAYNGAFIGTLALAPMFGGAPREIAEQVLFADHGAGLEDLAISREIGGRGRLEYPPEHVLFETAGWVGNLRIAPDGQRIAFCEHPMPGDDRGYVSIVDLDGNARRLTDVWTSLQGLAWSPAGDEIWFTAAAAGSGRSLYAVTPQGQLRCVSGFPGNVRLFDVARDGRLLIVGEDIRVGIFGRGPGAAAERDLTWLNWSLPCGLSADGRTLLFEEATEQVGANYMSCVRGSDGSPVVRLTEGAACGLSPDGKWAVTRLPDAGSPLVVVPVGAGRKRSFDCRGVTRGRYAYWLPDNRRFAWIGRTDQSESRGVLFDRESDAVVELDVHGLLVRRGCAVSPDGTFLVVAAPPETWIVPVDGGRRRAGPAIVGSPHGGVEASEQMVGMSPDGEWLWVSANSPAGIRVSRVHLTTGERQPWREFVPADRGGVIRLGNVWIARDADAYCYFFGRVLSELYVAEGME